MAARNLLQANSRRVCNVEIEREERSAKEWWILRSDDDDMMKGSCSSSDNSNCNR